MESVRWLPELVEHCGIVSIVVAMHQIKCNLRAICHATSRKIHLMIIYLNWYFRCFGGFVEFYDRLSRNIRHVNVIKQYKRHDVF